MFFHLLVFHTIKLVHRKPWNVEIRPAGSPPVGVMRGLCGLLRVALSTAIHTGLHSYRVHTVCTLRYTRFRTDTENRGHTTDTIDTALSPHYPSDSSRITQKAWNRSFIYCHCLGFELSLSDLSRTRTWIPSSSVRPSKCSLCNGQYLWWQRWHVGIGARIHGAYIFICFLGALKQANGHFHHNSECAALLNFFWVSIWNQFGGSSVEDPNSLTTGEVLRILITTIWLMHNNEANGVLFQISSTRCLAKTCRKLISS